jgi:Ni,Fe-hydrogenase III large subunit/Ni,Fe-hydrogenase III component G
MSTLDTAGTATASAVALNGRRVDRVQWLHCARALRAEGATLLALWGSDERDRGAGFSLHAILQAARRLELLQLSLPAETPIAPSLTAEFPAAGRMERAVADLLGIAVEGGDERPWLRHAAWAADRYPLRRDFDAKAGAQAPTDDDYRFVAVEGDGVHEIGVGPIHAGIIEPGHFRFSVVGEKVLRLEERLGYVHKGIEKRFEAFAAGDGHRLAARISGDSAVAFAWAYCMALEQLCAVEVQPRALWLRALALELERIANHLGDLGALGNDAGLAFGLAQFSRLKEDLLRVNAAAFSARYLFDWVVPGGVAGDLDEAQRRRLRDALPVLAQRVAALREIYDEHAGLQDRFQASGVLAPALAQRLGVVGFAARASGHRRDLRCDLPVAPYDRLDVRACSRDGGDVAARVALRFDELFESIHLCRTLLQDLPPGDVRSLLPECRAGMLGVGLLEGWRGPVVVALEVGADGRIRRCHPQDPSWQNWPALEHAIIGNIVPDFPLINKSFNLSYSGQDL